MSRRVVDQAGVDGVTEGAQHPCHIFERALLGAPIRKGTRGFSFKVQDDKISLHLENLSQVVITVDPDLLRSTIFQLEAFEVVQNRASLDEDGGSNLNHLIREK